MSESNTITVKKRTVCPRCGMTIEEGAEMFRSLKMPNKYICVPCAIMEREEIKKKGRRRVKLLQQE
jgi:late competence protein required for DNA uptake (superfamily II DNA/RNA helicase)